MDYLSNILQLIEYYIHWVRERGIKLQDVLQNFFVKW